MRYPIHLFYIILFFITFKISFSEDGTYFVTAGFRHMKFWYMDTIAPPKVSDKNAKVGPGQTMVIDGKAGVLGILYI